MTTFDQLPQKERERDLLINWQRVSKCKRSRSSLFSKIADSGDSGQAARPVCDK